MDTLIPKCVKQILIRCGFDNLMSIEALCESDIDNIENYVNKKLCGAFNFECCHSTTYLEDIKNGRFEFVPGHKSLILNLKKEITSAKTLQVLPQSDLESNFWVELEDIIERVKKVTKGLAKGEQIEPALSNILSEFIKTAITNSNKTKNQYRYSDIIQDFATYIYILSGRHCYEVISANLPMPAATTVCKSIIFSLYS